MKPHDDALFRALYHAYPDCILLVDAQGRIVLANPAATTLLGYSADQLVGMQIETLVPARFAPGHAARRRGYAQAPKTRPMGTELELTARRADGSEAMVEIALSPMGGDLAGHVVAAVRNIGAYPRVRRAIQRAQYNDHVVRLGRLAVDTLDPDTLLQSMPAVAAEALEVERVAVYLLTPDQLEFSLASHVGVAPAFGVEPRIANRPDTLPGHVVAHRAPVIVPNFAQEQRFDVPPSALASGTQSGLAVPLTDRGRIVGVLTAWSNRPRRFGEDEQAFLESLANLLATSLQRAQTEADLRHAQRLETVGQLTGGIAHDFNNLLTVIQGNLQLLADHPTLAGDALCVELIGAAQRASQRGAELTGSLLAFSRRQSLSPVALDPVAMIESMATMLRRTIGDHLRIEVQTERPSPWCLADPVQLESALLNVAINARDAMPKGGTLLLRCHAVAAASDRAAEASSATMVCFSVRDTGSGMSAAVRERAFEPFFTTKEAGRGTGLGLATVYGFVTQSGGSVQIDSAPGAGTTVTLALPAIDSQMQRSAAYGSVGAAHALSGLRVLLVEDDADVRALAAAFLGALGCRVAAHAEGASALATLAQHDGFDLLFSDLSLGEGLDGHELALQAQALQPGLRVLLTSGYAQRSRGASTFTLLRKPFSREQLAAALTQVLNADLR